MPLTAFQREVFGTLRRNRSPESFVFGATVLNATERTPRFSRDIDLCHDLETAVAQSASADADALAARKADIADKVVDNAITSTMSRTIITHGSTQMMVTSMLIFGGVALHYFALALTIGICFGIYSSVLVASPIVMWLRVTREDLVKAEKKAESIGVSL